MSKLRDDLDGVVYINGSAFKAGDEIPAGAKVSASLLARESPAKPTQKRRSRKEG